MQFVLGVIGIILIYFLGNLLYPDSKQKEIIYEPRQEDYTRKDQIVEEVSDDEDITEQIRLNLQSEVIRITLEEIEQRVGAGEDISDEEKEKIIRDNVKEVSSNQKAMSPNEFHTKMSHVLMAMAVIGGVFSFIGYILAPDSCGGEENTLFESLGYVLFVFSMIAVPVNITIWLVSLFKSNVNSGQVFGLVCLHTMVVIIIMFVFGEYIAQDMFCNSEVFVWGVF